VSRHNEVMTPGRTKMSSTGHIRDWNAVVRQVPGSLVMKAVMRHRLELGGIWSAEADWNSVIGHDKVIKIKLVEIQDGGGRRVNCFFGYILNL